MEIPPNPASTKIARDVKNYRDVYDNKDGKNPHAKGHVGDELNARNPGKYPRPINDAKAKSYEGFQDFSFYKDPAALPNPNRLGGQLAASKPSPRPPKPVFSEIIWPPGSGTKIKINNDGSIVHTDTKGVEIPEAHEYMHAILNDILHDTRDKLEAINKALEDQNDNPAQVATYTAAVGAFNAFVADLGPGGASLYISAFDFVNILPVVTNEGFVVSVRIEINWKNPYHSSSTIRVP